MYMRKKRKVNRQGQVPAEVVKATEEGPPIVIPEDIPSVPDLLRNDKVGNDLEDEQILNFCSVL